MDVAFRYAQRFLAVFGKNLTVVQCIRNIGLFHIILVGNDEGEGMSARLFARWDVLVDV